MENREDHNNEKRKKKGKRSSLSTDTLVRKTIEEGKDRAKEKKYNSSTSRETLGDGDKN